jgi:putative chitinase
MSRISTEQMLKLNPRLPRERAALYAEVLSEAAEIAALTTTRRLAHFIGQTAVETGGYTSLVESTRYSNAARLDKLFRNVQGLGHAQRLIAAGPEAIGNTIYAGKNGNGDVASGDGFRFRGRGFMQVTGRGNYRAIGKITGQPLEEKPEMLGEPDPAAQAAAIYWRERGINKAADADDVSTVTLLVNGPARLHMAERKQWCEKAKGIWKD